METDIIKNLEAIELPLLALRAVTSIADEERGVYIHATGDEYRVVGTDGARLLVYSCPVQGEGRRKRKIPTWTAKGVVLEGDGLKSRLDLLDKLSPKFKGPGGKPFPVMVKVGYAPDAPNVELSDIVERCLFKVSPSSRQFVDYQRLIDDLGALQAREVEAMSAAAYQTGSFKDLSAVAKLLGSDTVQLYGAAGKDPTLVTFPGCPNAILIMAAGRVDPVLGSGAAKLLSGAVALTVKALKAHQTRWQQRIDNKGSTKADKAEAQEKVAEYQQRIAAVLAQANQAKALPAPATPEPETAPEPAKAVEVEPSEDEVEIRRRATFRRGLKPRQRANHYAKFIEDVDKALTGGTTVLSLGVPIDEWYTAGLSADMVVQRCQGWSVNRERKAANGHDPVKIADAMAKAMAEKPVPAPLKRLREIVSQGEPIVAKPETAAKAPAEPVQARKPKPAVTGRPKAKAPTQAPRKAAAVRASANPMRRWSSRK